MKSRTAAVAQAAQPKPAVSQPGRTPIAAFKNGASLALSREVHANFDLAHILSGGDSSVFVNLRASEVFRTVIVPVRRPTRILATNYNPAIGKIKAQTKNFGELMLDEFLQHPQSYAQGFIVVHKGEIVYENYPGMRPDDNHLWMSMAKTLPGLVIDMLISDGKIDQNKFVGTYIPELRGTAWENIRVIDILDMTPGLNSEENDATRADPDSIAIRLFNAEFGMPYKGKQEILLDVLKSATKENNPGDKFEYGSPNTQVLVFMAEAVSGKRWADFVDERIWSKIGAEAPLQIHTSPDGIALGHGLVSSKLRDLARFGMQYTPNWNVVSYERVVTPEIVKRIQDGVRAKEFFRRGFDGPVFMDRLNDQTMISNSRQWDAVWPDGDFWKAGLMSQALYASPKRDLVIAFFTTNVPDDSVHRFLRPIATSGLFDK